MADDFLTLGRIVAPHGIRGEVKVRILTDDIEFVFELEEVYLGQETPQPYAVKGVRLHKGMLLLMLEGVSTRNDAEALRGEYVVIPREWVPPLGEDEYYVHQLIGLRAMTTEGEELGRVADVMFTNGANDVYVIRGERYGEVLIPAIRQVVKEIDLEKGEMLIELMDGLLE